MFTLVVPIFRNEATVHDLITAIEEISQALPERLETVFVVDGSPDRSGELLLEALPRAGFPSEVLFLSRNFGSFAAIRAGLEVGRGERLAVMAADLQEPPDLIVEFQERLAKGGCDVVVGARMGRTDPIPGKVASSLFWWLYRTFVQPDIPPGGVDVFACTREFRDHLIRLTESNTTLVGLIFWMGFRREVVQYERRRREKGRSGWTLSRKMRYFLDSCFAFSDLPIRFLTMVGVLGILLATAFGLLVLAAKLRGDIPVPGYAATVLSVVFFGGLNCLATGLLGEYLWRAFENTKHRPGYLVARRNHFQPGSGETDGG